jgi:Ca-activated chloride channel family protein
METLADNGNGNYSYIDSILEAKKVLVEEMGGTLYTVAKDVKLQVEFNPAHLKGYRLIGYENRMLNTEDFEDDTKDAGEIGAGHRVTALYELIEVSSDQEVAEAELKYQPETTFTDDNNEWLTVSIRYKEPDQDTSQLLSVSVDESDYTPEMSDNLLFASSVAAFGMLLRDSDWKGSASYQMILDNLKDQDFSNDEYKDEFISLVKKLNRIN